MFWADQSEAVRLNTASRKWLKVPLNLSDITLYYRWVNHTGSSLLTVIFFFLSAARVAQLQSTWAGHILMHVNDMHLYRSDPNTCLHSVNLENFISLFNYGIYFQLEVLSWLQTKATTLLSLLMQKDLSRSGTSRTMPSVQWVNQSLIPLVSI